jgi:serine/threonine protein kinase
VGPTARRRGGDPRPNDRPEVRSSFGTFRTGEVVGGRWRLDELVCRTATGTRWRATSTDGRRQVLFELIQRSPSAAAHVASARAVATVRHPHLLAVADVQRRDDDVLVVAEFVDAPSLARTSPPAEELAHLGAGVAGALAALHGAGLAHLEVGPDAILVPDDRRVRLVDLGSGRVLARAPVASPSVDRFAWAAPEQIVARQHAPPADVYALGLTLWVAAGGRLGALGDTPAAQAQRRLTDPLPPLSVDEPLASAIAAATRPRPAERPTAEELAELLAAPPRPRES